MWKRFPPNLFSNSPTRLLARGRTVYWLVVCSGITGSKSSFPFSSPPNKSRIWSRDGTSNNKVSPVIKQAMGACPGRRNLGEKLLPALVDSRRSGGNFCGAWRVEAAVLARSRFGGLTEGGFQLENRIELARPAFRALAQRPRMRSSRRMFDRVHAVDNRGSGESLA